MQLSSFCPAKQKLICQGTKDLSENMEIPRPGPGGPPHAFRPSPSPGRRCRLHPKINKWQHVRSTPLPAGTPAPRTPPAPAVTSLLAEAGPGVLPRRRRPHRPASRFRQPRRGPGPAESAAGPAGGPETRPGPRKSPALDRTAAGAGLAQNRPYSPAPHGTAAPQPRPGTDELRPEA